MDTPTVPPTDAARALAEIQTRREQVATETLVPNWYWPAVAVLMVGFVAAVESHRPWVVAVSAVVYPVALSAVILAVVRRSRVQVRNQLIGVRGGLAIAGLVVGLVALGLGVAFALSAAGVPAPATIGVLVTGVAMTVAGPRLMRHLRTVMVGRPIGAGR